MATSAYNAGARLADIVWVDEEITHTHLKNATEDELEEIPNWMSNAALEFIENGDPLLNIVSRNPDLLSDIEPERISKFQTADLKKWERVYDYIKKRSSWLNALHFTALHYHAPGTDLTVGLPGRYVWLAVQMKAENGIEFTANLPTEEVFTMPHKERVNGTVSSSRPLVVAGQIVEDFHLTFENGKITDFTAKKGEESLRKLIETDDGARSNGEMALVPISYPVSRRGHLFYNTLFDENAASHIAIGRAYRFTMSGGNEMSEEEFQASGGNFSLTHNDFMVGSDRMEKDGIREDGSRQPVMRAGEWAFEV